MPTRLDSSVARKILEIKDGNNLSEESAQLGIHRETVKKYSGPLRHVLERQLEVDSLLGDPDYLRDEIATLSQSQLAKKLGISRTYLRKYLEQHGIPSGSLPSQALSILQDPKNHSESSNLLAQRLGVSPVTVRKYRRSLDIAVKSPSELSQDVVALMNDGDYLRTELANITITDLAKKLGVIRSTLLNYLRKHEITNPRISEETQKFLDDPKYLKERMDRDSIRTIATDIGVNGTTVGNYCRKHDIAIPRSGFETDIATWLKENGFIFQTNTRKIITPLELDFYLEEHKVAIEFNGLYWHSDKFLDKNYHYEKHKRCLERGITLFMINEDEWIQRSDVIKSSLLQKLGRGIKGIGARKLRIRSISPSVANAFFEQNHIQGQTAAIVFAYGAFAGDNMVAAMAFSKQRGTGQIELIRFCSDQRSHAGAFSKMFKHAVEEQKLDSVLSFADKRYSTGHVYERNGFAMVNEIPPDYRYVIGFKTHHKSNFTKSRIATKYGLDMSVLTERKAMELLDIPRIYDCGKLKYVWKKI